LNFRKLVPYIFSLKYSESFGKLSDKNKKYCPITGWHRRLFANSKR